MTPLRDYLVDAYGGFADRRHKDPALDRPIRVDDRGPRDVSPSFCSITVSVPDRLAQDLILKLHNAPACPEALGLVEGLGGSVLASRTGTAISLPLKSSQGPAIGRLARAIGGLVGRGRRYDDPDLKWICPRTAASLERLVEHLKSYREELWPDQGRHAGPIADPRSDQCFSGPWAPSPRPPRRVSSPAGRSDPATTRP